jgi:hypothetical protein
MKQFNYIIYYEAETAVPPKNMLSPYNAPVPLDLSEQVIIFF